MQDEDTQEALRAAWDDCWDYGFPNVVSREQVRERLNVGDVTGQDLAEHLRQRVLDAELSHWTRELADQRVEARSQRLDSVRVRTAAEFLAEEDRSVPPLLGHLASKGHNVTVTAAYKTGKTIFVANAAAALVTGTPFLEHFPTGRPAQVAWLNYELTEHDQKTLIRSLALPSEALERLLVMNLRGIRLSLTTPMGRDFLVAALIQHQAEVIIADTYGVASAPALDTENDNAAARRFLMAVDEIKELSGCPSSIWTCHTGRKIHEQGSEHARGATVLDDWADVRFVLTKDRVTGVRFVSSDGRGRANLPESALTFDPATQKLSLHHGNIGAGRQSARNDINIECVARAVTKEPGICKSDLRDALQPEIPSNPEKDRAIKRAIGLRLIYAKRHGKQVRHFPGPAPE